jgi:dynein heavy chain, axonemal
MRAIVSALRSAGANRLKYPELSESELVLQSLRNVNAPKLLASEIVLFDEILSDLFPGIAVPPGNYGDLDAALVSACEELNIQTPDVWLSKVPVRSNRHFRACACECLFQRCGTD